MCHGIPAFHQQHRIVVTSHGQGRGGGFTGNGLDHFLIDLGYRQLIGHSFFFVHRHLDLRFGFFQTVVDLRGSFDTFQQFSQISCKSFQTVQLRSLDNQLHAGTAQGRQIHGRTGGRDGAVQIGRGSFDFITDLLAGFGALLFQRHINGHSTASHGHHSAAFHGGHTVHTFDFLNPFGNFRGHFPGLFRGGLGGHFHGNTHLQAVRFRHESRSH